jgi:hypothetical protein
MGAEFKEKLERVLQRRFSNLITSNQEVKHGLPIYRVKQ